MISIETADLDWPRISEELTEFRHSALLFAESTPGLIDTHDRQWVAVLHGEVVASADCVDSLFVKIEDAQIDPRYALVRHIQRNQRTLIL